MKKTGIQVEDIIKYTTDIILEQPSYMSDEEFEEHLDAAEKKVSRFGYAAADELENVLSEMGFHIVETTTGYPGSPDSSEMEIVDVRDVKED